jgi:hypothetical protein
VDAYQITGWKAVLKLVTAYIPGVLVVRDDLFVVRASEDGACNGSSSTGRGAENGLGECGAEHGGSESGGEGKGQGCAVDEKREAAESQLKAGAEGCVAHGRRAMSSSNHRQRRGKWIRLVEATRKQSTFPRLLSYSVDGDYV